MTKMTIDELLEKIMFICDQEENDCRRQMAISFSPDPGVGAYLSGRIHAASDIWHKIKQPSGDKGDGYE